MMESSGAASDALHDNSDVLGCCYVSLLLAYAGLHLENLPLNVPASVQLCSGHGHSACHKLGFQSTQLALCTLVSLASSAAAQAFFKESFRCPGLLHVIHHSSQPVHSTTSAYQT